MAQLRATTSLDSRGFQQGTKGLNKAVDGFQKKLKSIGPMILAAFSVGAIVSATKRAIDFGSALTDVSTQLGIGVEELQTLQQAAKDAGVSTEILERGLRNLKKRTQDAIDDNKSYLASFKRLKIDVNEFVKLPLEQRMEALARASANATSESQAFKDVANILGERSGPKLQEVLQRIASDGMGPLAQSFKDSGRIMTEETAKALDAAADKIEAFKTKAIIRVGEIVGDISEGDLQGLQDALTNIAKTFGEVLIDSIRDAAVNLAKENKVLSDVLFGPIITEALALGKEDPDDMIFEGSEVDKIVKKRREALKKANKKAGPDVGLLDTTDVSKEHDKGIKLAEQVAEIRERIEENRRTNVENLLITEEKIAELHKNRDQAENAMKALEVEKEILLATEKADRFRKGSVNDLISGLNKMARMINEGDMPGDKKGALPRPNDMLTRIGGVIGGGGANRNIMMMQQQINKLDLQLASMQRIERSSAITAENSANITNGKLSN